MVSVRSWISFSPSDDAWTDLYTIHEYGGVPDDAVYQLKHPPTPRHARYWCYQLLRTLKFMHAEVVGARLHLPGEDLGERDERRYQIK